MQAVKDDVIRQKIGDEILKTVDISNQSEDRDRGVHIHARTGNTRYFMMCHNKWLMLNRYLNLISKWSFYTFPHHLTLVKVTKLS